MKQFLLFCSMLVATLGAWGQNEEEGAGERPARQLTNVVLPGEGHINVESLLKNIDTQMDISRLSLGECRVLRNAFAARQGYAFMAGDLRAIFSTTTWYETLMYSRFDKEMEALDRFYQDKPEGYQMSELAQNEYLQKAVPMKYTKAELAFMEKLNNRIDYLKQRNFAISPGKMVNIDNLINPWQLEKPDQRLMNALGTYGFAIVPNTYDQLFQIYENNDYHCFPNFVTTDLFLQLYHMYFDCMMREVEEQKLSVAIEQLCQQMYDETRKLSTQGSLKSKELQAAAEYIQTYYAVALALINGKDLPAVPAAYQQMAEQEVSYVMAEDPNFSEYLDYQNVMFGYNLFRPRGHYTRSETLKRYFRAMMWLQTVPFGTDKDAQLRSALFMADVIGKNQQVKALYNQVAEPITYLMGTPDNVTILQVYEHLPPPANPLRKYMKQEPVQPSWLTQTIEEKGERQTRIRPKFEYTSHCKINLMPQRYMPDGEVLQEMVDYDSKPTKRDVPRGLDFFAALGNSAAERILFGELNEATRWEKFKPNLERMKERMGEVDWKANVASQWMAALNTMAHRRGSDGNKFPTS